MPQGKQVFQTNSSLRWKTVQWIGRFAIVAVVFAIVVLVVTFSKGLMPGLPALVDETDPAHRLNSYISPAGMNPKELKKYKGFTDFLTGKRKAQVRNNTVSTQNIRAAFYVDWDPQSFYSLQKNIDKLNMVLPEWFFIDPKTDTLAPHIDADAFALMKKTNVKIVPMLSNVNQLKANGEFDPGILHSILHDADKRKRLIDDIIKYLGKYQLQGINIDFEEAKEKSDEPFIRFQKELYEKLHEHGFLVTQDVMPANEDYNVKKLSDYNDYLFLMAYDEHYSVSTPGPVCSQRWIEKVLDETAASVPSKKIILCIAGYGYDWADHTEALTVTYPQALATAKEYHATIDFDNDNYNNHYSYRDADSISHEVYFADAATNFNTVRFADQYATAGTALWRLGSEDERLWNFYNLDLSNEGLREHPFSFSLLQQTNALVGKPDYIGDGEILNVVCRPSPGKIRLEVDSSENMISEQEYLQLPTQYVIKKYGNVHRQVILTFDDGPDPEYTPQVLDILQKEKVPATFFVIGEQAESNLDILQRIYKDGYEIGNHTFTHPNIAKVRPQRALMEMESTRLLIEAATGRSTVLFRAPYNADAEPTSEVELRPIALSKDNNYYTVGESIDPNDWEDGVTADSIYKRVVAQYEANPEKGIILLHDAGGNREATVQALPNIIHYFKSKGVAFTTVASLLHTTKDVVMPPLHNSLVGVDGGIATSWFWIQRFLFAAFWVAIFLGLFRVLMMGVMAMIQKFTKRTTTSQQPPVSIIVPAYNEEVNAVKTIHTLLRQDYPFFEIIFVDDGSTDNTYEKVLEAFGDHSRVRLLSKINGGKASALNYGIAEASYDYVVCIDADTQLQKNAVTELMKCFINESIGAVAGNVKVGNENTVLTRWQSIEYTTAQNFDRRAFDLVNGITVVPGAIGAFRKTAIEDAGGFTADTLAEDCDLTIRILRNGYRVVNCSTAIAVTEAPETLKQFMKQRFRWSYGVMQSFWKNKDACFNPRYRSLGMLSLPNILLFQVLMPIIAPLADIMLLVSLVWNHNDPSSLYKICLYYIIFIVVDLLVSITAFAFEKERFTKLIWLIPQRFAYRQLMYVTLFKAMRKAIKGESQNWGVLQRTGRVSLES